MDLVKILKQKIRVTSAVVRGPKGNKGDQGEKGDPGDGVVYCDDTIDTTKTTSQSQYSTVDKFYPDVQDGYYFVDKHGAIGHVVSVSGSDVLYLYTGKEIQKLLPDDPNFYSVTLLSQSGDITLESDYDGPTPAIQFSGTNGGIVRIRNIGYAKAPTDAANKAYVDVKEDLTNIAPEFDATATYSFRDLCHHDGKLYMARFDIDTPGAWNSANWQAVTIAQRVNNMYPSYERVTLISDPGNGTITIENWNDGDPYLWITGDNEEPIRISNVATPQVNGDAANKGYVDAQIEVLRQALTT